AAEGFPWHSRNCDECNLSAVNRQRFGYSSPLVCACHDIVVDDVRAVAVTTKTIYDCVPCRADITNTGCRGGFLPDGLPSVVNARVSCASEFITPNDQCNSIKNKVEFEVVLSYQSQSHGCPPTLVVIKPRDEFVIPYNDFYRFPSGNRYLTQRAFREDLKVIDGSSKVIFINSVDVIPAAGSNCQLRIVYRVIDKLWKKENLLVSAIKPYTPAANQEENITLTETFNADHSVGQCTASPCSGA
ncbi:MAG: hypothetical protein Q4F95_09780, partial [Oscillospiraceae bacterium]|nr:hypothetical protein [Oscillospiraceae bacterium]